MSGLSSRVLFDALLVKMWLLGLDALAIGTVQMCLCVSHGFKSEFLSIYLSHGGTTSRSQALGHPQSLAC